MVQIGMKKAGMRVLALFVIPVFGMLREGEPCSLAQARANL